MKEHSDELSDIPEASVFGEADLKKWFSSANFKFMMQIYTMEQTIPRRFAPENCRYTGNIFLTLGKETRFELQYAKDVPKFQQTLWFHQKDRGWGRAVRGHMGEQIPAACFEFVRFPGEDLIEGHAMICFSDEGREPDPGHCRQLEVEMWK